MHVYADDIDYARQVLGPHIPWETVSPSSVGTCIEELVTLLFHADALAVSVVDFGQFWQYLFIVRTAPVSQYDLLIKLAQVDGQLPDGVLCLAGEGSRLHGFKSRPWIGLPGNIHLTAFLAPQQKVEHFAVGFTILSAVSVIETVDSIEAIQGQVSIKWVNDIVIASAKVSGVLAHTQSQGEIVTGAVLGIGLNVESTPNVERSPVVPAAASLRDFVPNPEKCHQRLLFHRLTACLERNYRLLLDGQYSRLLDLYRKRSLVLGREVSIYPDAGGDTAEELVSGKVVSIGENLELYLKGVKTPVTKGRIVLKS